MEKILTTAIALGTLFITTTIHAQKPGQETFKKVFYEKMQSLVPSGFTQRAISFIQVSEGEATNGYYPFKVSAYVMDYGPGYPSNKYYGQTCLGKMDKWPFTLHKDAFGDWVIQGRFTNTGSECKQNPSEGTMAFALPGNAYSPNFKMTQNSTDPVSKNTSVINSQLYIGEYAFYGTGGKILAGTGFHLLPNGYYYDIDKKRGGRYTYNVQNATITFSGGFLSGQVGKNVKPSGFQLSNTVYAEPWR